MRCRSTRSVKRRSPGTEASDRRDLEAGSSRRVGRRRRRWRQGPGSDPRRSPVIARWSSPRFPAKARCAWSAAVRFVVRSPVACRRWRCSAAPPGGSDRESSPVRRPVAVQAPVIVFPSGANTTATNETTSTGPATGSGDDHGTGDRARAHENPDRRDAHNKPDRHNGDDGHVHRDRDDRFGPVARMAKPDERIVGLSDARRAAAGHAGLLERRPACRQGSGGSSGVSARQTLTVRTSAGALSCRPPSGRTTLAAGSGTSPRPRAERETQRAGVDSDVPAATESISRQVKLGSHRLRSACEPDRARSEGVA